jgi:hypothetical protein
VYGPVEVTIGGHGMFGETCALVPVVRMIIDDATP